jgi:heat shock protein HtpX
VRRRAFAADRGLRIRVAVALLLNGALLLALLAVAVWLVVFVDDGWAFVVIAAMLAAAGAETPGVRLRRRRGGRSEDRQAERAERAVSRLSVVADLPKPTVRVVADAPPLSWTTVVPWRGPEIFVTEALLDRLPDAELEAVLGHEVSHLANRDATVMTVLSAPGIWVLRGLRNGWRGPRLGPHDTWFTRLRIRLGLVVFACLSGPPALVSAGLARVVSRHRELAADRGAALLTGSPAAMASALVRLTEEIAALPARDLRAVAARDLLHVLPVRTEATRGIRRLWATHPPLPARLRQLERLEAELQASG